MKLYLRYFATLLLFSIVFSLNTSHALAKNYDVEEVVVEPFIDVIKRTGKVNFKRTLNLSFKASGFLTQLSVDEGDRFEKQQLLASLDTTELEEDKNAKYALLLQAKRDVNRIKTLLDKELSSQQELDNALTNVETARANYKIAFYNLEKALIYAPFSGIVVARYTELGELQSPNKEALKVAALENNLVVSVALTGEEISLVRLKQRVRVNLHHLGSLAGVISKIPAIADSESHLFIIEVLLPFSDASLSLIAGQIAQVIINVDKNDFTYRLPVAALNSIDEHGNALIAIDKNGGLQQQAFKILKLDNHYLYIQAKANGDPLKVITQGWQHLSLNANQPSVPNAADKL